MLEGHESIRLSVIEFEFLAVRLLREGNENNGHDDLPVSSCGSEPEEWRRKPREEWKTARDLGPDGGGDDNDDSAARTTTHRVHT